MSELHVVFGAGALGHAVAREAIARGHRARIVTRSGKAEVPVGCEVARGDVSDGAAATEAARGASVVRVQFPTCSIEAQRFRSVAQA